MRTSEQIGELAAALAKAQGAMKNAGFDAKNPHFKNEYATLSSVRDAVVPHLSANGIALIQGVDYDDAGHEFFCTRLAHSSGQWIEGRKPLPSIAKAQDYGAFITYMRRYFMASVTGIASEKDDDGNAANEVVVEAGPIAGTAASYGHNAKGRVDLVKIDFDTAMMKLAECKTPADFMSFQTRNKAILDRLPEDRVVVLRQEYKVAKMAAEEAAIKADGEALQ